MNDLEKRAHDLAIVYVQVHPPKLDAESKENEESRLLDFAACYESAFKYFKSKLSEK